MSYKQLILNSIIPPVQAEFSCLTSCQFWRRWATSSPSSGSSVYCLFIFIYFMYLYLYIRFLCYGGNSGQINVGLVTSSCPNLQVMMMMMMIMMMMMS